MELLENDYFRLYSEREDCFVVVMKPDYTLKEFSQLIVQEFPRIKITKFLDMRKAFQEAKQIPVNIGILKPLVELTVSPDKMTAKIKINSTQQEFESNTAIYQEEIVNLLCSQHILYKETTLDNLPVGEEVEVANGIPPVHGEDAKIRYYQLSERKPSLREDGKVDYFVNLIDQVDIGDWLGEKIFPTKGIDGANIFGEPIPSKAGKDRKFQYDRKTIEEVQLEDGRVELRSSQKGAVLFKNGKITVGKLLAIQGDVGMKTGNVNFDGSVTIKGVVQEGFSVIATEDISIEGAMGVSGFKLIQSKEGDVFIKGGAMGKGASKIVASNNVFVKFVNECSIEAGGDIHIGLYAFGSHLKAKNVIGDDKRGKIVGGELEVEGKVVSAYIGNESARKTVIKVNGIDRTAVTEELSDLLRTLKEVADVIEKAKSQIGQLEQSKSLHLDEINKVNEMRKLIENGQRLMQSLDRKRKSLMSLLEIKGDGQVSMVRQGFPMTSIAIKDLQTVLTKAIRGTYYADGDTLHFEK